MSRIHYFIFLKYAICAIDRTKKWPRTIYSTQRKLQIMLKCDIITKEHVYRTCYPDTLYNKDVSSPLTG